MAYEPVAFVYDADVHCPDCARDAGMDKEGAVDSEGNPVGVVAPWDDNYPDGLYCGTCGDEIVAPTEG